MKYFVFLIPIASFGNYCEIPLSERDLPCEEINLINETDYCEFDGIISIQDNDYEISFNDCNKSAAIQLLKIAELIYCEEDLSGIEDVIANIPNQNLMEYGEAMSHMPQSLRDASAYCEDPEEFLIRKAEQEAEIEAINERASLVEEPIDTSEPEFIPANEIEQETEAEIIFETPEDTSPEVDSQEGTQEVTEDNLAIEEEEEDIQIENIAANEEPESLQENNEDNEEEKTSIGKITKFIFGNFTSFFTR